jgi:hypothetical protein
MSTDLNKYKRYTNNILDSVKIDKKKTGRKSQGLSYKVTINFTQEEIKELQKIHDTTGAPISTIIRRHLIKSGLIKEINE